MKPVFIIYSPMAWNPSSGGILALHKLAHNISSLGETCFITTSEKNPSYLGQQINDETAKQICANDKAIVIYPEIVRGNPLQAKFIMRWLLNTPGVISYCIDAQNYAPGHAYDCDMFYKFAPIYKAPDESKGKGELRALENWFDVFKDRGEERNGSCYIYKKGNGKVKNWHPDNAVELDGYEGKGNEYLADIFNRSKVFISYDSACYLSVQAALCGCLSIVVPDKGISKQEWHDKFPYFKFGVAYGLDDIEFAYHTMPLIKEHLEKLENETIEQTKGFIQEVYSLVGKS